MDQPSRPDGSEPGGGEEEEELGGGERAMSDEDYDTDLELEGTDGRRHVSCRLITSVFAVSNSAWNENDHTCQTENVPWTKFLCLCAVGTDQPFDPTGRTSYMEACEVLQVPPASCFLRHMHSEELSMKHYGLGPQVPSPHRSAGS